VFDLNQAPEEQKKKTIKKFRFINAYIMVPLYRIGLLPLMGFGRIFLLLETIGRKSGKKRITPLEYHRIDGVVHIFSARGEDSHWFKNLQETPALIKLGFRRFKPKIIIINDKKEKFDAIKWYVLTHPTFAKYLIGWNEETDDPDSGILEPLINKFQIIKLFETR
jgi:deazaflavin-dependent oxidoreductase (nitroreductase family)